LARIDRDTEYVLLCAGADLGIAESLSVGFVSFGLLAAAWMLVAVGGLRRHAAD
jgi:hypothetical protein